MLNNVKVEFTAEEFIWVSVDTVDPSNITVLLYIVIVCLLVKSDVTVIGPLYVQFIASEPRQYSKYECSSHVVLAPNIAVSFEFTISDSSIIILVLSFGV